MLQAVSAGVEGIAAVPAVGRTGLAAVGVFGLCGLAATRLLLPAALWPYRVVLLLPLGAACSTLALTVLGLAHVPFSVSLPVVLGSAAVAAVVSLRVAPPGTALAATAATADRPPSPAGPTADPTGEPAADPTAAAPPLLRHVLPLVLSASIAFVALVPVLRAGFATVIGQNGDAVLAVGTGNLLKHIPPTGVDPALPVDRPPLEWRSKAPIYYGLAAISAVAGQDTVPAFPTVCAVMLGLVGLGLFIAAAVMLRAPPLVALAVLALVPLNRMLVYVAIHPYYNQLWGIFTLPFILVFGWLYLRSPDRRSFGGLVLFTALGLFAYPLMLPFPVIFLAAVGVSVWREQRSTGQPVGWVSGLRLPRMRWWTWVLAALVAVPLLAILAVLVRGVAEKAASAARVALPGGDLSPWHGTALPYLPLGRFFGIDAPPLVVVPVLLALFAAGWLGLRRASREVVAGLGAIVVGGLLIGVYFLARGKGELFYFKDMAFTGPVVTTLALVGLGTLLLRRHAPPVHRAAAAVALIGLTAILANGARREIRETYDFATTNLTQLRDWDRRLPPGASVRIDVPPNGYQLWTWYFLASRPVSASQPLLGFTPHPPFGLKADYALAENTQPRPPDARGAPVLRNGAYSMFRLGPGAPGPDVSSRALVYPVTQIEFGK